MKRKNLRRGLRAVFAAVHGDQDGHGNERQLPEAVVDHQVERDEDAEHRGLLNEKERVEDLAAFLDRVPTGQHANGGEQSDEDNQPQAEAVDADVIGDGGTVNPGPVDLELKSVLVERRNGRADEESAQS